MDRDGMVPKGKDIDLDAQLDEVAELPRPAQRLQKEDFNCLVSLSDASDKRWRTAYVHMQEVW